MEFDKIEDYLNSKYKRTSSFSSGLALFLTDAFSLFLSIGLGFFIVNIFNTSAINFKSFCNYTIFIPVVLIIFACMGLYPGIMSSPTHDVKNFFLGTFFTNLGILFSFLLSDTKNNTQISYYFIKDSTSIAIGIAFLLTTIISTFVLPAFREISKHIFCRYKWWGVPAIIYCKLDSAKFIIDKLCNSKYLGYHPALIIDDEISETTEYNGIPVFPPSPELLAIIKKNNIKQAVICDYKGDFAQIMSSYRYTTTISKNQTNFTSTQTMKDIGGIIGFSSIHNLTFKGNLFIKRLIDILIILFFMPFILPLMLVLAILTKLTSKGPVFYGHKRIGKNGKVIKCWKFRSMCINSQEILEQILATDPVRREEWEKDRKFKDDPRVTKFGKFLRKTSLDELPQLFNVLFGDMSLIGPRPVTEPELVKYGEYKDYVLSVLPGLSGMWQVSGRSDTGYEERISFDTYYIQNWSIWLDIWILIKTVWVVIVGKGAV